MRPAIRDLISERLELKLGEPMDSLFDRKKQQGPPSAPGRGITPAGEFFYVRAQPRYRAHRIYMVRYPTGATIEDAALNSLVSATFYPQ